MSEKYDQPSGPPSRTPSSGVPSETFASFVGPIQHGNTSPSAIDVHAANSGFFLSRCRPRSMRFSEYIEIFENDPESCLHTSSTLIANAIEYFGFEIVVRSGEPTISYNIFKDLFSNGTTAVFGHEYSIKHIVDVIDSAGKESAPQRGIVLVGPPASGKTNIVDLIGLALAEYSRQNDVQIYSFYFHFENDDGQVVEFRPALRQNPILLFPRSMRLPEGTAHPRQALFDHVSRKKREKVIIPTFYQNAYLDKRSLDIIESLQDNPKNRDKSMYAILEEYTRVEEIDFSMAQAKGIANIDDMRQLKVGVQTVDLGSSHHRVVSEHLPGAHTYQYDGAMVAANRGLLHVHDAFGAGDSKGPSEIEYRPLLMLLGSGKASVESTQTPIDATVIITTNLEEMKLLEKQLTSSKLLDRIEEIPVNYLLDAYSEMEILKRDMTNIRESFDVDPNLLRVATCFAVLTRLLPPMKVPDHVDWSDEKVRLYLSITPEQKLFIYGSEPDDPTATIQKLPRWHNFRSEMIRLGYDVDDLDSYRHLIAQNPDRMTLDQSGVFTADELKLIDDDFMRRLWKEHATHEGKHGISVRQLQNIMRDTIAHSLGFRVHVGTFFSVLDKLFEEGRVPRRWLTIDQEIEENHDGIPERTVGELYFDTGEADYGDFEGLARVTRAIYYLIIRREITVATVNRDPEEIALDLRRYIQHALLVRAHANRAFAHIMIPRFSYLDPVSGERVDEPDFAYLESIEEILCDEDGDAKQMQLDVAQRYLDLHDRGALVLEDGRSVITSRQDNVLSCFGQEYSRLLSHRRTFGDIDPDRLTEAFFKMRSDRERYEAFDAKIKDFAEEILNSMVLRFRYSETSAQETVLFALRKGIIDFSQIIS